MLAALPAAHVRQKVPTGTFMPMKHHIKSAGADTHVDTVIDTLRDKFQQHAHGEPKRGSREHAPERDRRC